MSGTTRVPLLALAAVALVAAGCGGDDDGGDGMRADQPAGEQDTAPNETTTEPGAEPVTVQLDDFSFRPKDVKLDRGATIRARNVGGAPHNLTIEQGPDPSQASEELAATPTFDPGGQETLTVDVEPGTYALVCTVPGHRDAGMVGSIKVR